MTFPDFLHLIAELRKIPPRKDETLISGSVEDRLNRLHFNYRKEAKLAKKERIDFLVQGVGIELKTSGNSAEIARQCYRYADHLQCLILVSSKPVNLRSGNIRNARNTECYLEVIELWNNPL